MKKLEDRFRRKKAISELDKVVSPLLVLNPKSVNKFHEMFDIPKATLRTWKYRYIKKKGENCLIRAKAVAIYDNRQNSKMLDYIEYWERIVWLEYVDLTGIPPIGFMKSIWLAYVHGFEKLIAKHPNDIGLKLLGTEIKQA